MHLPTCSQNVYAIPSVSQSFQFQPFLFFYLNITMTFLNLIYWYASKKSPGTPSLASYQFAEMPLLHAVWDTNIVHQDNLIWKGFGCYS